MLPLTWKPVRISFIFNLNFRSYVRNDRVSPRWRHGDRYATRLLEEHIKFFEKEQLFIILCNALFSRILFTGKLMAFSCSIFGTFYVVKNFRTGSIPLLANFAVFSIDALAFYVLSCRDLYEVPRVFREAKQDMLSFVCNRLSVRGRLTTEQRVLYCRFKTKPIMGISDGGFRSMESISVLVFLDFYVNQVISLLLTF